ncbi:APH(3'') family aminoglycoside O-phosphotransferase [Kitasatospora sp. NPDC056327]|uniref:APH(3'') family aminoglycoside O-phosphotransferase n=1 Tax=Kitasatospora sp. NPDC056327 TaxID=3345785 RepID=UPI0035DA8549
MDDRSGPGPLSPNRLGVEGAWLPVTSGESGALVFRSADATRYAKCVPGADAGELAAERDRTAWLDGRGVSGPGVLGWAEDEAGACLVTGAVPGVPADRLSPEDLSAAWERIADAVRRLHEVPVRSCPFDRDLDAMVDRARDVVARGAVNPEFLPDEQQRTPPADLLAAVTREVSLRRAQEAADRVVCHGDLCLPNIVLDPRTLDVSGFIDLGRLGRADRHADLALLLANARETWPDEARARAADAAFADRYGTAPDGDRLRFYLALDPLTWG